MKRCCFCCSLEYGANCLGVFDIWLGIFSYATYSKLNGQMDLLVFNIVNLIGSVIVSSMALTAGIMVIGIYAGDRLYIRPWIIVNILFILCIIASSIVYVAVDFLTWYYVLPGAILICAIRIYFMLAMRSLYIQLDPQAAAANTT